MLAEKAAQLPLPDPQPARKSVDVASVHRAPSISARARETVLEVPRQAPRSGEASGRQRRQGR